MFFYIVITCVTEKIFICFLLICEGKCHEDYADYQKRLAAAGGMLLGAFKPDCRMDGHFKVKQCNPSAASCWCVNTRTGEMIPGTAKQTFIATIDCSQFNNGNSNFFLLK